MMDETQVLAGGMHVKQTQALEWIAQADTQLAVSIRTPFLLVRMLKKKKQPVGPAHVALGNNRAMVLQRARACLHVWEKQKAPLLKNGAFSGEARIYALMAQMVLDKRGRICKSDIETTLAHYAAYGALTLQEAMLVRPAVELALFELLRLALQEDEKDGQEQKTARFFARKLEGKHAGGWLQTALFYARHGGLAFAHYLQQEAKRCPPHIYSQACDNTALPLGTSAQQIGDLYAEQRQARQELVHHIVQSLQGLAQQTQTTWLTLASPAAALLWQETDFTLQDEATQARLYVQIASMAQKSGHSERTVVRTAQRLCVQYGCPFCHLFFGEQQKMLYDRLHLRMRASHTKRYKWLYLLGTVGVWAGSLGLFLFICLRVHAPWLETLGLCAFGSLMVWTIAQAFLDRILVRFLPPAFLPKLRQMPAHAHTVVVLPVVIEREEQIDAYFAALQRQYHAFRKAERMILLCDLPPTNTKDNSVFIPWLDHGVQTVARYNAQGEGRYTFVVRPQRWVSSEGKWMGWDRKRGALLELNRALLGRRHDLWCYGEALPEQTRYVLTLDADTQLPTGEAERLVCTLAHPANARYAVAQPRMVVDANCRTRSRLARLYAGPGLDGYGRANSDIWMDMIGYGLFMGKGLYDLAAFTDAVERLPANRFLSHDLLEGALAGCAYVSDVQAIESFPLRYTSYAKRQHRWIRGDWQLMPCAVGVQKDDSGRKLRLPGLRVYR